MDKMELKREYAKIIEELTGEIIGPISKLVGLSVGMGLLRGERDLDRELEKCKINPDIIKIIIGRYCVARGLDNDLKYVYDVIKTFEE